MVVTKQAARRCHWREALGMNDKLDRSNTGRIHLIARSLSVRLSHSGTAAKYQDVGMKFALSTTRSGSPQDDQHLTCYR